MALISNGDCEEAFSVPRHCRLIQPENCQFVQFVHIHGASISTHGLETLRNQVFGVVFNWFHSQNAIRAKLKSQQIGPLSQIRTSQQNDISPKNPLLSS